jgi:hypothetical protein
MTSNGVETTRDLANRASIVRIKKRPRDYTFTNYSEGSLFDHVAANQAHYLGCVFAIVREWVEQGKHKTSETRHDFREWAQVLDWIVQNILGEAPLMDGHEQAQERVSNPALTWLRKVALAVSDDEMLDKALLASELGQICENHDIEIPGLKDSSDEDRRNKQIGSILGRIFRDSGNEMIELDSFTIDRTETTQTRSDGNGHYILKAYTVHSSHSNPLYSLENGTIFQEDIPLTVATVENEERAAIQAEGRLSL